MSRSNPTPYLTEPYDYAEVRLLADGLDLAEPVATALVRRGHGTLEAARCFLTADESHDPALFAGIDAAIGATETAMSEGRRITVHGDYDVDGICSTAILIGALRRRGAVCDWIIPDRLADGYGLSARSLELMLERGTGLLITADCGISSAAEIDAIKDAGIAVVVTDHHQPPAQLPDCPVVHPVVSNYPFEGLCGAGVAHKLVLALERAAGSAADEERDLDLVALATVADMVPLVGENRSLARRGLRELRRARRPGLRALLSSAGVEPERLDEGDIAFRLAPRLNAAGRLYRADAGVELMLTEDPERAATIAAELDSANHERRDTERAVSNQAEAALRALGDDARAAPALVIAGEGWHPGVVGIVASRIVERHGRPAIVLSIDDSGNARGSGRSVPGFDLLSALDACADHLERYGGHRAAAGVELAAADIEAFRAAFVAHARSVVPAEGLAEPERIDAVVGAEALDLRVAEQLEALAPFGQGNPGIRLLIPGARVGDVKPMGEEGRHARFNLTSGGLSARGVAFNSNPTLEAAQRAPHDLTVRLEVNHWNGGIEPRAVLSGARRREAGGDGSGHICPLHESDRWWWERYERELGRGLLASPEDEPAVDVSRRRVLDARRGSAVARIAELLSSGDRVLLVAADAGRRAGLMAAVDLAGDREAAVVCLRCPPAELLALAGRESCSLLLTDWASASSCPEAVAGFEQVVAVDPPPGKRLDALIQAGSGYLHEAWGASDDLAEPCWDVEWSLRTALGELYRSLAPDRLEGEALRSVLIGAGRYGRSPEAAARCVRVLTELGVAESGSDGDARWMRVVSSKRTELEQSGAWRAFSTTHQEGRKYLQSRRTER
ncbi:MAG: single-stranded-DNA-specific exonuclease RecJ [Solirubrobacterales bacterium]